MKRFALLLTMVLSMSALCGTGCSDDDVFDVDCEGGVTGAPCDDSNPCTRDDFCEEFVCQGVPVEQQDLCDDGDACTVDDRCVEGLCSGLFVCTDDPSLHVDPSCEGELAEEPCDDGDLCTEDDQCDGAGSCVGRPMCTDADGDCLVNSCDPETGACVPEVSLDGTTCDDGDACVIDSVCHSGGCQGGTFAPAGTLCNDLDSSTDGDRCLLGVCEGDAIPCDPQCCELEDGSHCSDGNLCTQDVCHGGFCVGTPCDADCGSFDSANGCQVGACDPATGVCTAQALPSGGGCDDGDLCTVNDSCQSGTCRGVAKDCSDQDAACLLGSCDQETGACMQVTQSDGTPCNDSDSCTGHDSCTAGSCQGAFDLCAACAGQLPGAACNDGDPCAASTGTCIQVASGLRCETPKKDCSSKSSVCALGVCDAATGECVAVDRPAGAACDDGNTCTDSDKCLTPEGEDAPICQGTGVYVCADEAQTPDFCEPNVSNKSLSDAIPTALHEKSSDEDNEGGKEETVTIMGTLSKQGDIDWYVFSVAADDTVTIRTQAHCLATLSTILHIVRPTGDVFSIPGIDGGCASLTEDAPGGSGNYYVGIGALAADGKTAYQLEIDRDEADPCHSDSNCGDCDQLKCFKPAGANGICVAKNSVEFEPNNSPGVANSFGAYDGDDGGILLARLGSPGDSDWFSLELDGSAPVTLTTTTSCDQSTSSGSGSPGSTLPDDESSVDELVCGDLGEVLQEGETEATPNGEVSLNPVNTEIVVFASDGETEMAVASTDGEGSAEAVLYNFLPPAAGTYFVRVRGEAGSMGPYTLGVKEDPCFQASDCSCSDQKCGNQGACMPKLSAPEPVADLANSYELNLGVRLHATIDAPYDKDTYAISLGEGTYEFVTETYCGSVVDTNIALYDNSGAQEEPTLIDESSGGGDGPFAAISNFTVGSAQTLDVVVRAKGAAMGSYILVVRALEEAGQ